MSHVMMNQNMVLRNPVGTHLLVNVYDVPHPPLLTHLSSGRPILDQIVTELQLTVVSQTGYQFNPTGYTYAYVLSESHFTIHTYPEFNSCYIDIFCCNPHFNAIQATNLIRTYFNTHNVVYNVVRR
jgi:S-adenosylmethionine decarboxylase proenzyme